MYQAPKGQKNNVVLSEWVVAQFFCPEKNPHLHGLFFLDFDECSQNNGGCEETCVNTVGAFYCECLRGWALQADGFSCIGRLWLVGSSVLMQLVLYLPFVLCMHGIPSTCAHLI